MDVYIHSEIRVCQGYMGARDKKKENINEKS